ncbi:MAG: hypothetical protein CHKLHMKO_00485 [Candidatus Argoarchaeum ethanivorans]|uniref:Uncharacterized protein n=1 Tax=Candidatus Argoarchaeum ethanivorans TaxID=2608793 RepID=A0A811TCT5_9EURY|nr:MAG: hypothetical protein CHKLHMKO_00485 [Candidatus Argoarchaeum ethanivorans]
MANGIKRFIHEKVDFVWVNYVQLLRSLHNMTEHHLNWNILSFAFQHYKISITFTNTIDAKVKSNG